MKKAQLSGSLRANVGKKDAKALRDAGRVPCELYGTGELTHFSVRQVYLEKIVFSPDVYHVELDIEGVKKMAIIQDKHMHPVKDKPLHIYFL
jgi:large subunit ribosomal protein L25